MTELRVAIIGAGTIALGEHVPAWLELPGVQVTAVADSSPAALAAVDSRFQIDHRQTDYRRLLDSPGIDVVDICVPSALHAEVTIAALGAGKHVLCEKPMATSRAAAAEILQAWQASDKKLMIAQHMRFEPSITRLRQWFDEHPPGKIYHARSQWMRRRRLPAKASFTDKRLAGGGVLYDLGTHMLDLAWWLMGCPQPTTASGAIYHHLARRDDVGGEWGTWDPAAIEVEDFAAGLFRFAGQATLSLEVSWLALQPEKEFRRLQLYGTQAGAVWPQNLVLGERNRAPWDRQLAPATGTKAHHQVVHHFGRAVLDDTPVPVPPEQSANVIAMLEGLYHSGAEGHEVPVETFGTLSGRS
jgi:predicted dehydrogenase